MGESTEKKVLLTGFADEAAIDKQIDQQFAPLAALGMRYFTIRFVDCGSGTKNVMDLDDADVDIIRRRMVDYGLQVSSIGSPIGKVKLRDVDDGSANQYFEPQGYLQNQVRTACRRAHQFDAKLIRGFSFYPPAGEDPRVHLPEAIDRLGHITELVDAEGLTFGLEVEANLTGRSGWLLEEIHSAVNHPALVLIFDGGNLVTQGYSPDQIFEQYEAMKPGLGWLHVKDHVSMPSKNPGEIVDEDKLNQYVPADSGGTNYLGVLKDLAVALPELTHRIRKRGAAGFFVDLEPHLKGGGQFGGFSGPDGFGIAHRALTGLLEAAGIQTDV